MKAKGGVMKINVASGQGVGIQRSDGSSGVEPGRELKTSGGGAGSDRVQISNLSALVAAIGHGSAAQLAKISAIIYLTIPRNVGTLSYIGLS